MIGKLENPRRVAELDTGNTLKEIGLKNGDVFCDIGAGTGLFAFAAAAITPNTIYAADISEAMRQILCAKNEYANVLIVDTVQKVPDSSCDVVLLCTVLHELDDIPGMACEIKRMLKDGGILAVIEFHKSATPMGPPPERRISADETTARFADGGFAHLKHFVLGDNLYCVTFKRNCII